MTKKLIETDIPLEAINRESAREKSIRHGHPSTLHLWWARRPLAAARAVLWASLVDDPGDDEKRAQLHKLLAELVKWENTNNTELWDKARAELPDNLPELLDPFAGGGSIPLEGQRLGLSVHAHDLNPIAVMINKAMIDLPARFANSSPVHPDAQGHFIAAEQSGAKSLADDVKYYGGQLKAKAFAKLAHMYPKVQTPDGEAAVIAWIWARTVKCSNPACGCTMPLVNSFNLSTKKGKEFHAAPIIEGGKVVRWEVRPGLAKIDGTVNRSGARCVVCGSPVGFEHIRSEGRAQRIGAEMIAVVAESKKGRLYLSVDDEQIKAADVKLIEDYPDGDLPERALGFRVQQYGMTTCASLFTNRQLTMLATFAELLPELRAEIEEDARKAGRTNPEEYARAVSVYLAFVLDKLTIFHSANCLWNTVGEKIENCFGRQAIPMVWNYAEGNPFSKSSGCFDHMLGWVVEVLENLPANVQGSAEQHDAQAPCSLRNMLISTDPPYYDNIGYSDLSDYFYIWMRHTLRDIYPELFRRVLAPKDEELIATPYRHDNSPAKAKDYFEAGMQTALRNMYLCASDDYPTTIYYAYKQKETDTDGEASTGWETMLNAVISAGFQVVATWPVRTERPTALKAHVNALASSVVLVCRRRKEGAPGTSKRAFDVELRAALREGLAGLLAGNIAPVDIPQAAIGKGIAVYSQYSRVVNSDGQELSVRDVLKQINRELDPDQMDMDSASRFCAELYGLCGWKAAGSDDANKVAMHHYTAVDSIVRAGLAVKDGSRVSLVRREELKQPEKMEGFGELTTWAVAQMLTWEMNKKDKGGIEACGTFVSRVGKESAERARELVYRLYAAAERNKLLDETRFYNALILSWGKILESADKVKYPEANRQMTINMEAK